jgi:hypothetical protein
MPNNATGALRLTFSFEGSAVQLLSQQSLDMLPPSDSLDGFTSQASFWYELRDDSAQPVYRRIIEGSSHSLVKSTTWRAA